MSEKETAPKPEIDQKQQVNETTLTEIEPEDKWLVSLYLSTYIIYLRYQVTI